MDGTAELRQLAHLLRIGAEAARDIAALRPADAARIEAIAGRAEAMAADLDTIAATPGGARILPFPTLDS